MDSLKIKFNQYKIKKFLYGGEMFFEKKPALVWTILGSCLAICFHNERLKTGAIVHAQLPERKSGHLKCTDTCPIKCAKALPNDSAYKYVECSIRNIIDMFDNEGIKKSELSIKLFGGANIIGSKNGRITPVGYQNIEKALTLIEEYQLKIVSQNIGGENGRKLFFLTDTGEVYLKNIQERLFNESFTNNI